MSKGFKSHLLHGVLCFVGTHPTGGSTTGGSFQRPPHQGNGSPSQRQTQHCCCVGFRDSCPVDRNSGGSSGGSFGGSFGGSPRIRGTNITQEDDLPEIAVRIVNNVSLPCKLF